MINSIFADSNTEIFVVYMFMVIPKSPIDECNEYAATDCLDGDWCH